MSDKDLDLLPNTVTKPKVEKPRLYKVILLNDDYTPREFVVLMLKRVFHMTGGASQRIMLTAHQQGRCVVVVCTRDVAETKAKEAVDLARRAGFPLQLATEPED